MNKFFNLQLFAEDPAPTEPQATEPREDTTKKSPVFTEEQQAYINELIDRTYAKASKKASDEAKKRAQEEQEAEKLKNMSEAERNAQRMKDMEKRLEAFEREKTENAMMAAAREELHNRGYSFADAIVSRLIGKDAEETKAAIDDFTKAYEAAVKDAVKKAVPSTEPRTGTKTTMTKAEIFAIKDTAARQKAIGENIDLFKYK